MKNRPDWFWGPPKPSV